MLLFLKMNYKRAEHWDRLRKNKTVRLWGGFELTKKMRTTHYLSPHELKMVENCAKWTSSQKRVAANCWEGSVSAKNIKSYKRFACRSHIMLNLNAFATVLWLFHFHLWRWNWVDQASVAFWWTCFQGKIHCNEQQYATNYHYSLIWEI